MLDYRTWTLVLNTLLLTGATCAISLPLGTALAWLLVRTDLPGRRVALMVLGLMPFVPLYLASGGLAGRFRPARLVYALLLGADLAGRLARGHVGPRYGRLALGGPDRGHGTAAGGSGTGRAGPAWTARR